MSDKAPNVCSFKKSCKNCKFQFTDSDRPKLCISMGCEIYTPCKKCQNNRNLDDSGLCASCTRKADGVVILTDAEGQVLEIPESSVKNFLLNEELKKPAAAPLDLPKIDLEEVSVQVREIKISMPGTPPSGYSEEEKEYYIAQWSEYEGFYRDPTAKVILHNIIILEIELNFTVSFITQKRGSDVGALEKQRSRLIDNLKELRNQLPEKEANDMSDDEKSIAMIYDRYCEEKKLITVGKVSRMISPEALALAPALTFPLNPQELLVRLGYRQIDAIQACEAILPMDLPSNPKKMLEFFGFFLEEKFAMPFEGSSSIEDEDMELPDLEEATAVADEAIAMLRKEAADKAMPGPMAGPLPRDAENEKDFIVMTDD